LSTTHEVRAGDTFSLIAAQTCGSDTFAADIARANPGIREPLIPGTLIRVPGNRQNKKGFLSSGLDVHVSGSRLITMPSFSISSRIDAIRKCSFIVPNEIQTRDIFRPLEPLDCAVGYNGGEMMIGRVGTAVPRVSGTAKELVISAYSDCARIESSTPPLSAFPLEFRNMTFEQIANHMADVMGIDVTFDADPGPVFKRISVDRTQTVLNFFSDMAAQRGLVITDDAFGGLVVWKGAGLGGPVLDIDDTVRTDVTVTVALNDDAYYSSVTGCLPTKSKARPGTQFTVDNPFFTGVVRPYTYEVTDIDQGELATAVTSTAARMFAGVFTLSITLSEWVDKFGEVLTPNTLVRVKSPDNYINEWAEFLIAGVDLENNAGSESATLECVLPSAFSGEMPEALPWR
jgi:prophage tail gpP-like protein